MTLTASSPALPRVVTQPIRCEMVTARCGGASPPCLATSSLRLAWMASGGRCVSRGAHELSVFDRHSQHTVGGDISHVLCLCLCLCICLCRSLLLSLSRSLCLSLFPSFLFLFNLLSSNFRKVHRRTPNAEEQIHRIRPEVSFSGKGHGFQFHAHASLSFRTKLFCFSKTFNL